MKHFLWLIGLALLFTVSYAVEKADVIIFSSDRPLQLDALLQSIEKNVINYGDIIIIYRSSSPEFNKAYQQCFAEHAQLPIVLKKQGSIGLTPAQDFKYLLLNSLKKSSSDYIAFSADDIIIKDSFDMSDCVYYLKKTNAYAFYLRLGENINQHFLERTFYTLPRYELIDEKIMKWKFSDGVSNWADPNNLDLTMYNKTHVLAEMMKIHFTSPHTLEGPWAAQERRNGVLDKYGICYRHSKTVCIPYNSVQDGGTPNYHMGKGFSTHDFLKFYNEGRRIDIDAYAPIKNHCAHMVIPLHLRRK